MKDEDFVSYEQAVRLKTAGFDWPCEAFYEHVDGKMWIAIDGKENWNSGVDCSAPSLAQAAKWLREVKGIAINVIAHDGGKYDYDIVFLPNAVECDCNFDRSPWYRKYESALSDAITTTIELLEREG